MGEWLPVAVGWMLILVAIVVARSRPDSFVGRELRRVVSFRATGERGHHTRRDTLRAMGLCAGTAALLFGVGLGLGELAQGLDTLSRVGMAMQSYSFIGFILSVMAAVIALGWGLRSLFWRPPPPPVELELWPAFADLLDALADGRVSREDWDARLGTAFTDPVLERMRRDCLKLSGGDPARLTRDFGPWLRNMARLLRAQFEALRGTQG
ncbi:MAG: hypothetical protein JWO05_3689 [Gemmatimonadetes bacterium]|nr:hypothetical protein [Gemmatimonadota bacterium]